MAMPLIITLYDKDEAPTQTYAGWQLSWRLVKLALEIQSHLAAGLASADELASLRGLIVEAFGRQFRLAALVDGSSLAELVTLLAQIVARFPLDMGLTAGQIERLLVLKYGWSLSEIDNTDADTLIAFLRTIEQQVTTVQPPKAKPALQPPLASGQTYCDQVNWL